MDAGGRAALQRDLTALASGDRGAFDPVFRRLWPLLRGFAGRCLPAAEAEDVAQAALMRVFSRASEFDPRRDALSWALGVAAWEIRTAGTQARRRREDPEELRPEPADRAPTPETLAIASDAREALKRALVELSPADAATLIAYARGERPNLPQATFRKRVERALARLRAQWRMDHGGL